MWNLPTPFFSFFSASFFFSVVLQQFRQYKNWRKFHDYARPWENIHQSSKTEIQEKNSQLCRIMRKYLSINQSKVEVQEKNSKPALTLHTSWITTPTLPQMCVPALTQVASAQNRSTPCLIHQNWVLAAHFWLFGSNQAPLMPCPITGPHNLKHSVIHPNKVSWDCPKMNFPTFHWPKLSPSGLVLDSGSN